MEENLEAAGKKKVPANEKTALLNSLKITFGALNEAISRFNLLVAYQTVLAEITDADVETVYGGYSAEMVNEAINGVTKALTAIEPAQADALRSLAGVSIK